MADTNVPSYAHTVPSPDQLRKRLHDLIQYWQPRNDFIKRAREMYHGKNAIRAPQSTQYQVRVMHTRLLTAAVNEKKSRFLPVPEVAVIPSGIGMSAQTEASDLERGLNAAMEEMERNSNGAVWDRVVEDAIYLDMGVERIERAPAAFWPELMVKGPDGKTALQRLFEDPEQYEKAVAEYKRRAGLPIRSVYVPLENFYPYYEGPHIIEAFEIEHRPLRSVISNPTFNAEARQQLGRFSGEDVTDDLRTQIAIVHYCNQWVYAYFALTPTREKEPWPLVGPNMSIGTPILLHYYEHKLGRVLYNTVPGRFGGWITNNNGIEPVMNALIELNQHADEMASQFLTNVRAKYWPNLKFVINPEYRTADGSPPQPPKLTDGEPLVLYVGEDVQPVFQPASDPAAQWLFSVISQQFHRLAGSPAIYGERERGVETGYLQNLQITQSEHLDTKLEQHLAQGAINRATLIALHVRAMNTPVYVAFPDVNEEGKTAAKYVELRPEKLVPIPKMSARVRKQRPLDFAAAVRTALDATANRRGPNTPLLPDDIVYEEILGFGQPDVIKKKLWLQMEQDKLLESGILSQRVAQRLGLAKMEEPQGLSPEQMTQADPALMQAMGQMMQNPQVSQLGGVSPEVANAIMQSQSTPSGPSDQYGPRRAGGTPRGQPQPEQDIGRAIARAIATRGGRAG